MEQNDNIIACRKQLTTALGQNAFSYWNFHKDWFRGKLTRAEFDKGCRNLLTTNEMNMIHNQFVALLIRRLQISASSLQIDHNHPNLNTGLNAREKDRLALTKNYLDTQNDEQEEIPNEALNKQETGNLYNEMLTNRFAAQELILPDKRMILGRIILTSWSHDLEGTDTKDRVADVIAEATKILLKNIITAVIQNRTTYRNFDRHFQYDYGCDVPDPRCKITKDITDEWNDHYIPSYKYANKKSIWDLRQSQSCKRRELELIYKAAASPFKLHESYPVLYDVLQSAPEAELLSRVNAQRMYTTYQIDYCGKTEYPAGKFDAIIGAQGAQGLGPCTPTTKLPDDPCRPNQRPIAYVQSTLSPTAPGKACKQESGGPGASSKPSPQISEYMDNISKMGRLIMKEKIHFHNSSGCGS